MVLLVLVVLLGGGYAAAYVTASNKVPVGTRVAGVDIGGRTLARPRRVLREGLADRAATPFTVVINGRKQQVAPAEVGLAVDYVASVHAAGAGRSWAPSRLWAYYTGGGQLDPVVTVSERPDRLPRRRWRPRDRQGAPRRSGPVPAPARGGRPAPRRAQASTRSGPRRRSGGLPQRRPAACIAPDADGARHRRRDVQAALVRRSPTRPCPRRSRSSSATPPSASSRGDFVGGAVPAPRRRRARAARRPAAARGSRQRRRSPARRSPVDATVALVDGEPQVVADRARHQLRPRRGDRRLRRGRRAVARERDAAVSVEVTAAASFTTAGRCAGSGSASRSRRTRPPCGYDADRNAGIDRGHAAVDGTVLRPGESLSLRTPGGTARRGRRRRSRRPRCSTRPGWPASATSAHDAADLRRRLPGRVATRPCGDGQDLAFTDNTPYGVLVLAAATPGTPRPTAAAHRHALVDGPLGGHVDHGPRATTRRAGRRVVLRAPTDCQTEPGPAGFDVDVTRAPAHLVDPTLDHTRSCTRPLRARRTRWSAERHHAR